MRGKCGVYKITNIINQKCYIGSSVNVMGRFSNHMNRDARRYPTHPFYKDVLRYGRLNFVLEILEECSRESLIEREQYYYDLYLPEYNIVRPSECNFHNPQVREKAITRSRDKDVIAKRKALYKTEYYHTLFSNIQKPRFKSVTMYNDNVEMTFINMCACARWLDENTPFKGKNKVSKIKAVCDGKRATAFGYKYKYNEV